MNEQNHGEITEKHHFTIELEPLDLEELIYDHERTIETDEFVATVEPPPELDEQTRKNMITRLVRDI